MSHTRRIVFSMMFVCERKKENITLTELRWNQIEWAQVLVVQEKSGYFKDKNVWKLPTGVVNEVIYISSFFLSSLLPK